MGHSLELGAVSASRAVRCAFVGDEPLVEQCADIARTAGLDVVLVATTNAMVRDYAIEHGIPVVGPIRPACGTASTSTRPTSCSASPTCA